jgi:L-ascorbate metabolism protein UlaG (beta-lactamase superfamily)
VRRNFARAMLRDPFTTKGMLASLAAFSSIAALALLAGLPVEQAARPSLTIPTFHNPVTLIPIYGFSFLIGEGNKSIYVDPARPANFEGLPHADVILITSTDHMDTAAIAAVSTPGTEIIAPPAVAKTITKAHVLKNGEMTNLFGWFIAAVPMYSVRRGPAPGKLYHEKGSGNGYLLTYGSKSFYVSGDTEDTPEVRALKEVDVVLISLNAPVAMSSDEAVQAVKALNPRMVIPYGYHGSDLQAFAKGLESTGIDVKLLDWYPKAPQH